MSTLTMDSRAITMALKAADRDTAEVRKDERPSKSAMDEERKNKGEAKGEIAGPALNTVDREFVERAQAGDQEAFRILVEKYQKRAHAIALGILGNYDDAEDVAQQAFLKAYRNLSKFRGQSSFYTWLYRIVFNLAIDLSRKSYRKSEHGTQDASTLEMLAHGASSQGGQNFISSSVMPDEQLERKEIRKKFLAALETLSDEHRAVIMLREIDGLSYDEISNVVGCTKGTVMSRLHHARKRLQKAISSFDEPEQEKNVEDGKKSKEGVSYDAR